MEETIQVIRTGLKLFLEDAEKLVERLCSGDGLGNVDGTEMDDLDFKTGTVREYSYFGLK